MRASITLTLLLGVVPLAYAADARELAAGCAGCHGTGGRAVAGMPVIAGTPAPAMRARLLEFRDGRRAGTVMPQLAKGYSDAEIDALAAWFATSPAAPGTRP